MYVHKNESMYNVLVHMCSCIHMCMYIHLSWPCDEARAAATATYNDGLARQLLHPRIPGSLGGLVHARGIRVVDGHPTLDVREERHVLVVGPLHARPVRSVLDRVAVAHGVHVARAHRDEAAIL